MNTTAVVATSVVVVAALVVGVGIYEHYKHSQGGSTGGVTSLQPGHRYSANISCPGIDLSANAVQANIAQAGLPLSIVSISVDASGHNATVVFDYTGAQMPIAKFSMGMPCTVTVSDLGQLGGSPTAM
jgi:hypothetical protein